MASVPQKHPPVKYPGRLRRNVKSALQAGYNIHVRTMTVLVDGITVERALFEDCHPITLLSILDKHIGRKGLWFPPEEEV